MNLATLGGLSTQTQSDTSPTVKPEFRFKTPASNHPTVGPAPKHKYLALATIRQMLARLLEKRAYSKTKLAQKLAISCADLQELLQYPTPSDLLIVKVNLPLIKLYCATKFANK